MTIQRIAYADVLVRMHARLGANRFTMHFIKTLDNGKVVGEFRQKENG